MNSRLDYYLLRKVRIAKYGSVQKINVKYTYYIQMKIC